MSETTGRLLALLAALQARPMWSGPELAARLDVTVRTVRRDVERLRQLGYPVESEPGVAGGYRRVGRQCGAAADARHGRGIRPRRSGAGLDPECR